MSRKLLFILLSLSSLILNSQIKDLEKVLSGDYQSMKENKIKTITLKSANNELVNEIIVNSKSNELLITNSNFSVFYHFNDFGNPVRIIGNENAYTFDYFDGDTVKSFTRTALNASFVETTFRSDPKNLKTIHYKSIDFTHGKNVNVKNRSYVYNQQNPKLSYYEQKENSKIIRTYENGTKVTLTSNENSRTIDSTFIEKEKGNRYFHFKDKNKDSIVFVNDSVVTQILKNGKLSFENSYFNSNLIRESFFDAGDLQKTKKYQYLPYYENEQDTSYKGIVLWEVKTTIKGKSPKLEFPLKEHFHVINGKLIEDKKNILKYVINPNDIAYPERKEVRNFQVYFVTSTSILSTFSFLAYIVQELDISGNNEMNYCRYDFDKEKCNLQIGDDFDMGKNLLSRILKSRIIPESYKVEIRTEDNKTYQYKLNDFVNNLKPTADLIGVAEQ
ncbi:hypothetical protein [Soonwooa sp.]|uniref:hypothetical protein n=1 Tax=Soonwooa sp. TaxID=1938592 RepID=UPI00261FC797|nr:hypothetical protein [Soonwooa sp.]